jgi:hypothetical protein
MRVLVSDTSVIVDLERGQCLEPCFKLPCEFVVPDLLYKRELLAAGGPALCRLGLKVEILSGDEVAAAQDTRRTHSRLSLPDAYAFTLAQKRGWALLTGDGELRALAQATNVPFHGVLWVMDQLFEGSVLEAAVLIKGLTALATHPRCRLPKADIELRLVAYRKGRR